MFFSSLIVSCAIIYILISFSFCWPEVLPTHLKCLHPHVGSPNLRHHKFEKSGLHHFYLLLIKFPIISKTLRFKNGQCRLMVKSQHQHKNQRSLELSLCAGLSDVTQILPTNPIEPMWAVHIMLGSQGPRATVILPVEIWSTLSHFPLSVHLHTCLYIL